MNTKKPTNKEHKKYYIEVVCDICSRYYTITIRGLEKLIGVRCNIPCGDKVWNLYAVRVWMGTSVWAGTSEFKQPQLDVEHPVYKKLSRRIKKIGQRYRRAYYE